MLSERNWSGESVLRMLLGLFGTVCVVSLVGSLLRYGIEPPQITTEKGSMMDLLFRLFASHGIALAWVGYFLWDQRLSSNNAFGLRQRIPKAVCYGFLAGIFVIPIVVFLHLLCFQLLQSFRLGPEAQELVTTFRETAKAADQQLTLKTVLFGISVIVLAPIVEEILFRGILYPTLRNISFRRVNPVHERPTSNLLPSAPQASLSTTLRSDLRKRRIFATLITAFLFALMHNNLAGIVPLMVLGIVLVLVYEETDNLLAPILVHSVYNGATFVQLLLFGTKLDQTVFPT